MEIYSIRAHHGMCLAFFQGKGYNDSFTKHMQKTQEYLYGNPIVHLVTHVDEICCFCPNNINGSCKSALQVEIYDNQVLQYCGLSKHTALRWKDFKSLVDEKILQVGKREKICGDCQWNSLCCKTKNE